MNAIIAAVMASVEPHVIVTPSLASALMPLKLLTFAAIASLSSWDPMVISYWLWSPLIAAAAARLTESGAGKSGDPWARLTAPTFSAKKRHVPDRRVGEESHPPRTEPSPSNSSSRDRTYLSGRI